MKYTNENGEVIELPDTFTPEQLTQMEADKARLEAEKKDLEEAANPNFKKMRESLNQREELLRKHGIKIDGDEKQEQQQPTAITPEMIKSIAQTTVQASAVDAIVDAHLQGLDEPTKAAVKTLFNKLTAGEQLSPAAAIPYLEQAKAAAYLTPVPNLKNQLNSHPVGSPPAFVQTPDSVARGLEIAKGIGYQFKSDKFNGK